MTPVIAANRGIEVTIMRPSLTCGLYDTSSSRMGRGSYKMVAQSAVGRSRFVILDGGVRCPALSVPVTTDGPEEKLQSKRKKMLLQW